MEPSIITEQPYKKKWDNKVQIQIKDGNTSRSFTLHNIKLEYVYELIHFIFNQLFNSPTNSVRMVCYKPPVENNKVEEEWNKTIMKKLKSNY